MSGEEIPESGGENIETGVESPVFDVPLKDALVDAELKGKLAEKFKSVDALASAYLNLQSEYTKTFQERAAPESPKEYIKALPSEVLEYYKGSPDYLENSVENFKALGLSIDQGVRALISDMEFSKTQEIENKIKLTELMAKEEEELSNYFKDKDCNSELTAYREGVEKIFPAMMGITSSQFKKMAAPYGSNPNFIKGITEFVKTYKRASNIQYNDVIRSGISPRMEELKERAPQVLNAAFKYGDKNAVKTVLTALSQK